MDSSDSSDSSEYQQLYPTLYVEEHRVGARPVKIKHPENAKIDTLRFLKISQDSACSHSLKKRTLFQCMNIVDVHVKLEVFTREAVWIPMPQKMGGTWWNPITIFENQNNHAPMYLFTTA